MAPPSPAKRLDWVNVLFLAGSHIVAVAGTAVYVSLHGFSVGALAVFAFFMIACGFSVTAGYHRLFSHGAYEAHPAVRLFYLIFGAAAFENSALRWARDHRMHHARVDEEEDPYNIRKGFWWAHVGWVFYKTPPRDGANHTGDLERDPLVLWQDRFYLPLAIATGFALPLLIGYIIGDPYGAFLLGGFVRIVLLHHATFCVNSLAHSIGRQPYSASDSSRDSFITALVTLGEGYHNYHHTFPFDYRNGVRAWQFDPSKWIIWGLSRLGLASRLIRTPSHVVIKARLQMQARRAELFVADHPRIVEALQAARQRLEELLDQWGALKARLASVRERVGRSSREGLDALRFEIAQAERRIRSVYREWRRALQNPELLVPAQ